MTQGPTNDQSHTSYGITIKRDIEPKKEDDGSFQSSQPEVPVSQDAERLGHTKPPVVDHTPAKPALEQAEEQAQEKGNDRLAALLAKAGEAAKELAKKVGIGRKERANNSPRGEKKKTSLIEAPSDFAICPVIWTEADVVSDEEFIKRTISTYDYNEHSSGSIHSEEMKKLFYANRGQRYLDVGLEYGAAFSMLRADRIRAVRVKNEPALQEIIAGEWKRNQSTFAYDVQTYVAGLPTVGKFLAIAAAEHREADLMWMEERIENIPSVLEEDEKDEEGQ